ncbi:hypothetical protein ACQZ5N_20840 [Agrobacterium sp. 22-221-1]
MTMSIRIEPLIGTKDLRRMRRMGLMERARAVAARMVTMPHIPVPAPPA